MVAEGLKRRRLDSMGEAMDTTAEEGVQARVLEWGAIAFSYN